MWLKKFLCMNCIVLFLYAFTFPQSQNSLGIKVSYEESNYSSLNQNEKSVLHTIYMRCLQDLILVPEINIYSDKIEDSAYATDKEKRADILMNISLNQIEKDQYTIVCSLSKNKEKKFIFSQSTPTLQISEDIYEPVIDELIYNILLELNKLKFIKLLSSNIEKILLPQDIRNTAINYLEIANEAFDDGLYNVAFDYFLKENNITDAKSQFRLAELYASETDGVVDYYNASVWYEKAAEQGYVEAQYNLGYLYYYGNGVEKDYQKAKEWYEKAAKQGNANAQSFLGYLYDFGEGVEQDYRKAKEWYEKAAEQGLDIAQMNLGYLYFSGEGVEQDYQKAKELCEKAAEQGFAAAQYNLGDLYYYGYGTRKNYRKAKKWYEKAAEQGLDIAQNGLGDLYYYGEGVEKDFQKAKEWYEKAAEQGYAEAQNNLGNLYYSGKGVEQDYQKAKEWYEKAAEQGYDKAQNILDKLY